MVGWLCVVVQAEGLYKNFGDTAPLKELIALKKKYFYRLFLDETHSFGCYGKGTYSREAAAAQHLLLHERLFTRACGGVTWQGAASRSCTTCPSRRSTSCACLWPTPSPRSAASARAPTRSGSRHARQPRHPRGLACLRYAAVLLACSRTGGGPPAAVGCRLLLLCLGPALRLGGRRRRHQGPCCGDETSRGRRLVVTSIKALRLCVYTAVWSAEIGWLSWLWCRSWRTSRGWWTGCRRTPGDCTTASPQSQAWRCETCPAGTGHGALEEGRVRWREGPGGSLVGVYGGMAGAE